MKKVFAIMMMAAALAACTREEQPPIETPTPSESPTTYTLTIKASKGIDTRALVLVGNTLKATWESNDQVDAYINDVLVATLTPDLSGEASCNLKGTFNQLPQAGDVLTLKFNNGNYLNQDGTLAYIGSHCDYAVAIVQVTGVNGGIIESTEGTAEFKNQQAIVKFSLKDKSADTAIQPSSFSVKSNGTEVATVTVNENAYSTNGNGVLFVAIPAISGTIDLTAMVGSDTYIYTKESVTFNAGEYSSITVKMTKKTSTGIDLSDESLYVNGIFTAQDGDVLTGEFKDEYGRRILIADGATVTLNGVNITKTTIQFPGIELNGSATIILEGKNDVSAINRQAGIMVGPTSTLTITGEGRLTAGAFSGAGIGSNGSVSTSDDISCGNIVILNGIIEATSTRGAGIGCGSAAEGGTVSCGDITISAPARVTAEKGWDAPYSIGPSRSGQCGTVTIYGTTYVPEPGGILSESPLNIPITSGN